MKTTLFFIAFVALLSQNLFSASNALYNDEGKHCLLFTLSGLDNIGADNYNGGIGYQYYITKELAVRTGLGFSTNQNDEFATTENPIDKSIESMGIAFSPGVKYCFSSSSTILGYVGAEFIYDYYFEKTTNTEAGNTRQLENNITNISTGLFLGAEWFAWENVSLSAEYKLRYMLSSGDSKRTIGGAVENSKLPESTKINLGTSQFALTLSFYLN